MIDHLPDPRAVTHIARLDEWLVRMVTMGFTREESWTILQSLAAEPAEDGELGVDRIERLAKEVEVAAARCAMVLR